MESDTHTVGYVVLWFVVPLLLVLGIDVLVIRRRERKYARKVAEARKRRAEMQNAVSDTGEDGQQSGGNG